MSKPVDAGSLRTGSYIIIDNEPCHIVEVTKSKPGKHGSAKARIVAIGVFDGVKRSIVKRPMRFWKRPCLRRRI